MIGNSIDTDAPEAQRRNTAARPLSLGFREGDRGTHTSRTIMLDDLSALLGAAGPEAGRNEFRTLVVESNCLGKQTVATRRLSHQRLSELYGLDDRVVLFRIMRRLWFEDDRGGRPLLALLLALARDPLLKLTASPIVRLRPGEELGRQALTDALTQGAGARFNEEVLDKIVRNSASSWTQSGHLQGRSRKTRCAVHPTPHVTTFAILLGYARGARGIALFESPWAKVLDVGKDELISLALEAKRAGYLDMTASGNVVDVILTRLLTPDERRLIHGSN